MITLTLP